MSGSSELAFSGRNYIHPDVEDMSKCVHISDVRTFNQCRLKWYWFSNLGRGLEPAIPNGAFWLGTGVHEAIRQFHLHEASDEQTVVTPQGIMAQWIRDQAAQAQRRGELARLRGMITDQGSMGLSMLEGYYKWWVTSLKNQIKFLEWEVPFRVPLTNSAGQRLPNACFSGRLDSVILYQGELWIGEFKTTGFLDGFQNSLWNDNQCSAYQWAMRELGIPVKGTVYILMQKKEPDFRALNKYFRVVPIHRSPSELDVFQDDLFAVSSQMVDPDVLVYPAPSQWTCKGCFFENPCTARTAGADFQSVLGDDFRVRDTQERKEFIQ